MAMCIILSLAWNDSDQQDLGGHLICYGLDVLEKDDSKGVPPLQYIPAPGRPRIESRW
jgi:hypothetical protein